MRAPSTRSSSSPEQLPYLSPAEWQVFFVLSKKGPLTVRQLVADFEENSGAGRCYTTIMTLAQRLAAKGYLTVSDKAAPSGPASAITFSAHLPYRDALRRHAERFLAQYTLGDSDDLLLVSEVIGRLLTSR